jgi:hypothetical protein
MQTAHDFLWLRVVLSRLLTGLTRDADLPVLHEPRRRRWAEIR